LWAEHFLQLFHLKSSWEVLKRIKERLSSGSLTLQFHGWRLFEGWEQDLWALINIHNIKKCHYNCGMLNIQTLDLVSMDTSVKTLWLCVNFHSLLLLFQSGTIIEFVCFKSIRYISLYGKSKCLIWHQIIFYKLKTKKVEFLDVLRGNWIPSTFIISPCRVVEWTYSIHENANPFSLSLSLSLMCVCVCVCVWCDGGGRGWGGVGGVEFDTQPFPTLLAESCLHWGPALAHQLMDKYGGWGCWTAIRSDFSCGGSEGALLFMEADS
jgi:hypothetical protein